MGDQFGSPGTVRNKSFGFDYNLEDLEHDASPSYHVRGELRTENEAYTTFGIQGALLRLRAESFANRNRLHEFPASDQPHSC